MAMHKHGVILVGHGGIPKGCPQELVTKLKRLEGQRRAVKLPPSAEERELDAKIRQWPRTAETDPYQAGLEAVAARLRARLDGALFAVAYNEFCAPTLEESVESLIKQGATHITVTTTMFTRGSHSEVEIPTRPPGRNIPESNALRLAVRSSAGREHLGGTSETLFMRDAGRHTWSF